MLRRNDRAHSRQAKTSCQRILSVFCARFHVSQMPSDHASKKSSFSGDFLPDDWQSRDYDGSQYPEPRFASQKAHRPNKIDSLLTAPRPTRAGMETPYQLLLGRCHIHQANRGAERLATARPASIESQISQPRPETDFFEIPTTTRNTSTAHARQ